MQLVVEETSLVITGSWNPAILTPNWILQNAYPIELAPAAQNIQAYMPIGVFYAFPKYTLGQIDFTAGNDIFVIHPFTTAEDNCGIADNIASKVIELLPHTPITGIGHNFEFREEQPSADQLNIFVHVQTTLDKHYPDNFSNNASSIITTLTNAEQTQIINITQYYDGNRLGVKFNFHHPLSNSNIAQHLLKGEEGYKRFYGNFLLAQTMINAIYGEIQDGN